MMEQLAAWMESLLGPTDWATSFESLLKLLEDPFSNILVTILLISIIVVLVLLVAVVFLLALFNADAANKVDKERVERERLERAQSQAPVTEEERKRRKLLARTDWAQKALIIIGVLAVIYGSFGYSTQQRNVCLSCHDEDRLHSKEFRESAHNDTDCSSCHEGGNVASRTFFATPSRVEHIVSAVVTDGKPSVRFTPLVNSGCTSCHDQLDETLTVAKGGLTVKVAHKQPLEAGMRCVDCHAFAATPTSQINDTGMQSCLVCHNDEQESAACVTCHVGDPAAAQKTKPSPENARTLYQGVDCYSCHNPRPCDSCHGVRMPHKNVVGGGYLDYHADDARQGYTRCYKCHDRGMCEDCHFDGAAPVLE